MKIEIRHTNIHSSESLSQYIERRIYFALSRFENKVRSVTVRLEDLNGPRGGLDKKCQFLVRLKSKMLVVEGVDDNFYTAIDLTVDRVQRQVAREVSRLQSVRFKQAVLFSEFVKRKPAA